MRDVNPETEIWAQEDWIRRAQQLLDSYARFVGSPLLEPAETPQDDARRLFLAPFVVVAHGTQSDPLLDYANRAALELWAATAEELVGMPSRLTAEAEHRDERAELLKQTREQGFFAGYRGIRISRTGRRFEIHQATVWNVLDASGQPAGQAATFREWTPLG